MLSYNFTFTRHDVGEIRNKTCGIKFYYVFESSYTTVYTI